MCRTHRTRGIFVVALLLLILLVGSTVFQWKEDSGRSLELDTSRLVADGTVGVRISPKLPSRLYAEGGWVEVARQDGETLLRQAVQPGEWSYIALKSGNGKYTFRLWNAEQSDQDTPAATQHLEVMSLKPV